MIEMKEQGNFTSGSRMSILTDLKSCEETEGSFMSETKREITIVVEMIENIKDPKVKEISVAVEFLGTLLNQLDHIPVVDNRADIQLTATITPEELNAQFLDTILSNPVLFTILDCPTQSLVSFDSVQGVSPTASTAMEDKRKESKTSRMTATKCFVGPTVLGICNLDIGSLASGEKRIRETLLVESDKKVLPPEIVSWVKLPKLVVVATTGDEPLLLESGQKLQNVVGITIESVYNVPENIPEGSLFDASIFMPTIGDKTTKIKFPNGVTTSNPDFTYRKKWMSLSQLEGLGARAKYKISPDTREVITDISEDINVHAQIQSSQKIIQWNMWKNCLMLKPDVTYFYSKIMKYRLWPIEICVSSKIKEQSLKDKSSKSDKKSKPIPSTTTVGGADHFTAFLNLSPLLYPGVTKARVAAQLLTYSQADLISKFGSEFILTPQQPSTATLKLKSLSVRSKASARDSEDKESPGVPVISEDGSPTFIMVEVELLKPFTIKRAPEELEEDLRAYLSLKGIVNRKVTNLTVVHDSFSNSILHMVSILTREYQNYHLSLSKNNPQEDAEPQFHKYLCKQKIFHQIRTTLENKIVHLITEKFGKMDCYEAKIPEMYVYLVNEMHKITNGCTLNEEVSSKNNYDNELWLYAEEAIEEEEYELARDYLVLKLSRNTYNPDNWLDIAVCCVRLGAYEEAVEAVKEALSLDFHHQIGLLMYALLMGQILKPNIAEVAFQVLLTKYPDFVEGWSALHYFYRALNNTEGALIAFKEAKAIEYERMKRKGQSEKSTENETLEFCFKTYPHDSRYDAATEGKYGVASFKDGVSYTEPLAWTINFCSPECIRRRTTVLFLKLGFCEYAAMSLSEELIYTSKDEKRSSSYKYYTAVNYYLQGRYEEAVILLQQYVKEYGKDCYLWSLIAHCYYKLENPAKAIACYEYVLESYNRPDDIHLIYLRIGFYYLQAEKYPCAKKVLLTACKYSPTPRLWKGVGLSCLMIQELEEAEIAFSEANYLDDRDPETWAYLAIVNANLRRLDLFKQCAAEAKKRGLKNQELVKKIKRCGVLNGLESKDLEF